MYNDKKIVMCGCCDFGKYLIENLINSGVKFDFFVTITPEQAEESKVSGYYDFRLLADKYNIPYYIPKQYSMKNADDEKFFITQKFDLLVQGGWQRLFPDTILSTLSIGAIGIHGSADFLPKGRGRSPLNWSIIENKKRFLLHAFIMKPGADNGDVFDVEDFDITTYDDINTLYYKNVIATQRMILRNLSALCANKMVIKPQEGIPSHYPKRTEEDGWINWEEDDWLYIYNLVRAVTRPYPGALAKIDGRIYKIWKVRPFDSRITYPNKEYGAIVEAFGDTKIINCRGGLLLLEEYEYMD